MRGKYLSAGDGVCLFLSVEDGQTCDDGNVCTEADGCLLGNCTGAPVVCVDGIVHDGYVQRCNRLCLWTIPVVTTGMRARPGINAPMEIAFPELP